MPSSAWAREKAEELLPEMFPNLGSWAAAVAETLDEAEARGTSRLRERIEGQAAYFDRYTAAYFPNSPEARHRREISRVLRGLLEEEG